MSTGRDATASDPDPSDPVEEPESPTAKKPRDWAATVLLPAAVGLVFLAVLISERGKATRDLQIFAPNHALPGATIPIRAVLYRLRDASPVPLDAPIRVELRAHPDDRLVSEANLRASRALGAEGSIDAPEAPGTYRLVAYASDAGREEPSVVSRRVVVRTDAPLSELRGRLQTEPQQWRQHRVRGSAPPNAMDARVEGGDCGLGETCTLLVWVGEPAAAITLEATPSSRIVPTVGCGGEQETTGIVRCRVRAHGGEADVQVVATRAGQEVGRRRVVLPMSPGSPMIDGDDVLALGDTPRIEVQTRTEAHAVVDLFHEGRWVHSRTVETGRAVELERALDAPGWWRLQARTDPFASGRAAVRDHFIAAPGEEAVAALARRPEQATWEDPLAARIAGGRPLRCEGETCAPPRVLRFLLTAPELELMMTPGATSGAAQWNLGMNDTRSWRRWLAAALIVLAGFFVATVVVRRGVVASREAAHILALESLDPSKKRRAPLEVFGAGLFVLAAFCVAAALVLSRGCM